MIPTNFIGLLVSIAALFIAYFFFEQYLRLFPCPLCILDRVVLVVMAGIFFLGFFVKKIKLRLALLGANFVAVGFGLLFSGRHVWVQNQALDPNQSCLSDAPEFQRITDFIQEAFKATTDCSMIQWTLFGISIPGLTLLLFIFLVGLLLSQGLGIYQDVHDDRDD